MPVKIDIDMPSSCLECPCSVAPEEGKQFARCMMLPIRDMDGKIVSLQEVAYKEPCIYDSQLKGRSRHCPLKKIK